MDDLISRQAAIDATWYEPSYTDPLNVLTEVRDRLEALPSAQPERKKGRWIDMDDHVMCSCCGATHYGSDKNFCPNCGADMRRNLDDLERWMV